MPDLLRSALTREYPTVVSIAVVLGVILVPDRVAAAGYPTAALALYVIALPILVVLTIAAVNQLRELRQSGISTES